MMMTAIIPTWNRAGLLGRAIRSVLAQRPAPCELIVVDDGSTDDTPRVVRELAGEAAAPIRLIRG